MSEEDRRIATRVEPAATIIVYDHFSGENIGSIANISSTGFMLVTDRFIELDSVFQFRLVSEDITNTIDIGCTCLWTSESSTATLFWSGFHIIDVSDEHQQRLDTLVEKLNT